MPNETETLASGTLPLDGSVLVTTIPPPGAETTLTLSGQVEFDLTGAFLDAAQADQPGSLIQIEPGQWVVRDAQAGQHVYTFAPLSPVSSAPSIRLDIDFLVDKYVMSPSEVKQALSGEIAVELSAVPVAAPGTAVSGAIVVASLAAATALAGVVYAVRRHRARDADIRRIMAQIRSMGVALRDMADGAAEMIPRAHEQVPFLIESAERLAGSARSLRIRLRAANHRQVTTQLRRIQEKEARSERDEQELKDMQQRAKMLEPLYQEERRITAKLEQIGSAMETLRVAWMSMDSPDPERGSKEAETLLDSVESEIRAAAATQRELEQL